MGDVPHQSLDDFFSENHWDVGRKIAWNREQKRMIQVIPSQCERVPRTPGVVLIGLSGWWGLPTPTWKMMECKSEMMTFPIIWKVIKFHGSKPPTSVESVHVGTYMWVLWVCFMFVGDGTNMTCQLQGVTWPTHEPFPNFHSMDHSSAKSTTSGQDESLWVIPHRNHMKPSYINGNFRTLTWRYEVRYQLVTKPYLRAIP